MITMAGINMQKSMVISHRKRRIMRFCISLMQVSMGISISNCFSDNMSFWRVMPYLYEVTSCVRYVFTGRLLVVLIYENEIFNVTAD